MPLSRRLERCDRRLDRCDRVIQNEGGDLRQLLFTMDTASKPMFSTSWSANLSNIPTISHSDINSVIQIQSRTPNTSTAKGYTFFAGSYIHDLEGKLR